MKNTLLTALIVLALGNLCRFGLPWWCLAPVSALTGWFFARNGWTAFFGGFIGGFALWYATAWYADHSNEGLLSGKVGQLFMGAQSSQLLVATGVLGAVVAAMGAVTGRFAKDMFYKPRRKRSYLQERRR